MGRALLAGWLYDEGYDKVSNRVYAGMGKIRFLIGPEIEPGKGHEYRVRMNISLYFCDTNELKKHIVRRKIYGELIVRTYKEEYPGGLDQWVEDMSDEIGPMYLAEAHDELGGLLYCECDELNGKAYKIEVIEKEYIPPVVKIPRDVQLRIERIEEMIKEAETEDERMALEEELRKLKDRYGIK